MTRDCIKLMTVRLKDGKEIVTGDRIKMMTVLG